MQRKHNVIERISYALFLYKLLCSKTNNDFSRWIKYDWFNLFRFEYELLANFLVEKRGYDPSLKLRDFELDQDFICKVILQ